MIETKEDIIRRFAYNFYQIRNRCLVEGTSEQDWQNAENAYKDYAKEFKLKEQI